LSLTGYESYQDWVGEEKFGPSPAIPSCVSPPDSAAIAYMSPIRYVVRLGRWFGGHRLAVTAVGACLMVDMAFNAFVPMAFRRLIDDAITPRNSTVLVHVLVALGIATILATAAGMLSDYLYGRLSSGVLSDIRQRLFDHLQTLSPAFFQRHTSGEISARYSTDLAGVEQTLQSWIPWGWKPAFDVIGYNIVLFSVDWRLALLAQLLWPMVLLGPRFFAPRASQAADERKVSEAAVLSAVDEATAGRHVVRAYGLERSMSEHFAEKVRALMLTAHKGEFYTSALERSAGIGILLLQIVVLGVGASMAFKGSISIGSLAAFYAVFTSLSAALLYLAQYSTVLINSAAGLVRIEAVLAASTDVPEHPDAVDLPPFEHEIRLRDCVFEPQPARRILDGVSLTITRGESVAFVGRSGSGKSTVLNAIMRTFDPTSGRVDIDGHDLRTVSRTSFVAQSAVVFQDTFLYDTTVRENVRLGRLDASDADVEAACRQAELHEIIMAMPRGYDSPVGERGTFLSGGHRQRVAIARALVRNPRILFLDEATASLDPGTESAINATLERLSRDRTVVAVTHRLASTLRYDRVFVMHGGRLVESGTHTELLAANGDYAALWRKQDGIHTSSDGARAEITPERLRQFTILSMLNDEMLGTLAGQFVTESVAADRDVVVEGDAGDKVYVIARGRVDVRKRDAEGEEHSVQRLADGDNFGELALLRNTPRSATIHTLSPCVFLTLHRQQFQQLLDEAPAVRAAILLQETQRSLGSGNYAAVR
jgi:ATP-binding cassette subfamily B protein